MGSVPYNHPIGKDYKWYFSCQLEDYIISPIPPIGGNQETAIEHRNGGYPRPSNTVLGPKSEEIIAISLASWVRDTPQKLELELELGFGFSINSVKGLVLLRGSFRIIT